MARRLLDQEEAARMLGVSVDELKAMGDRKEVFPMRDGANFRYKSDEIERLVQNRAAGGSSLEADDSILLSELELGQSSGSTPSTIIGKMGDRRSPADSDIQLGGSQIGRSGLAGASDVELVPDLGLGSDVRLVSGTSEVLGGGGGHFDDLEPLDLDLSSGSDKSLVSDSVKLTAADDLTLDMDELTLGEDASQVGSKGKKPGPGSSVKLVADSDDDMVLGGGSDITASSGDSGISLGNPADSGISLEQPLELGGSSIEMMELGEDDVISLEEDTDLESATQLKADDDFLLTPVDEGGGDDSDSGSQVIALDTEDDLGSAASMFGTSTPGMAAMLQDDMGPAAAAQNMGAVSGIGLAPIPGLMPVSHAPEAPYSIWNVLGLVCCTVLLLMAGMMMYDMVRHMWSWDQPYGVNSSLMDSFGKSIGWLDK